MSSGNRPHITIQPVRKESTPHKRNKEDKCESKTYFTATHALMLTLQSVTGKQTHEIMSDLAKIQEQMLVDYELDPHKKSTTASWYTYEWSESWNGISKRRTVMFPGTQIYITCNLNISWHHKKWKENNYNKKDSDKFFCDANTNVIHANFYMPQRKITFTQEKIGEIMLEGELFDSSEDIEELKTKDSLTPAEKREKVEAKKRERELKKKQKELEKKAKKLAKEKENQDYAQKIEDFKKKQTR